MFREMRKKRQQLSKKESLAALQRGSSGVLALSGDNEYPYAVPISYVLDGSAIYFHSAAEGHKIDAIRRNPKASFSVTDMDLILPERLTTCYRSVIAFGRIRILEDAEEILHAVDKLGEKYLPEHMEHFLAEFERNRKKLCVFRFDIESLTGKQSKELLK